MTMQILRAVLIAPSRYDRDGVAVFRFGLSPNGALSAVAGLAEDYNRRHQGRIQIDYEFFDEHVRAPVDEEMLRGWRDEAAAQGRRFVVMLCGIQTATYPRGRDIALLAKSLGIDVLAGGVHLSGHGPSAEFLISCGVHVAVGEVEPIWDELVGDVLRGQLRPLYRIEPEQGLRVKSATSYITAPDIVDVPFPHVPAAARQHYINRGHVFVDSSRGCPFLCSFCVVKNVFGRVVRSREPQLLVDWIRDRVTRDGIHAFSLSDDNFVRNPRHRELLELLAAERRRGLRFSLWLILDVEATCYAFEDSARGERSREFLRLCGAAGVSDVYIGLESTNDAALREMRKGVNRDRTAIHAEGTETDQEQTRRRLLARYKAAVDAWHSIGVGVECGYIFGFESDRKGAGLQAARDLIEIGVDGVTFYFRAPLPGSEDYADGVRLGTLLLDDFNEYFTDQPMLTHPSLSVAEMRAELAQAVRSFWGWRPLLRRLAAGVAGIGGARLQRPMNFLKRQVGCKVMLGRGMYTYVEGGIGRRRPDSRGRRMVVQDEEARRFYLGMEGHPSAPTSGRHADDSSMDSLPVLIPIETDHAIRFAS